jgi:hypothetical protein
MLYSRVQTIKVLRDEANKMILRDEAIKVIRDDASSLKCFVSRRCFVSES